MKASAVWGILLFLLLLHLAANIFWLQQNQAPLSWDQSGHSRIALEFAYLFNGNLPSPRPFLQISPYYPPITHILTGIVIAIFGFSPLVATVPISFYFVGSLLGVFLLTHALSKKPITALLATLLFSLSPLVYDVSRSFLLEIPTFFWLVFGWYFLFKSRLFTNTTYSLLFSVSTAALLLTKWSGLVYLLVPLAFTFLAMLRARLAEKQITHLFIGSIIIGFFAFPWYLANGQNLITLGALFSQGEASDPQTLLSIENLFFYLKGMINFQLTLIAFLGLLPFFLTYILHKTSPYKTLGLVLLSVNYLIFTFIGNKDIRYTLPLIAVFSMMCSWGITFWFAKQKIITGFWVGLLITYLVVLWAGTSFGLLPSYQKAIYLGPFGWIDYINTGNIIIKKPLADLSPNDGIVDFLLAKKQPNTLTWVMIGIDQPYTNQSTLDLEFRARNEWTYILQTPYDMTEFQTQDEIGNYLGQYDYFVIPTGEAGIEATRHLKALNQIRDYVIKQRGIDYNELVWFKVGYSPGEVLIFNHRQ